MSRRTTIHARPGGGTIQAPLDESRQDIPSLGVAMACSKHQISYYAFERMGSRKAGKKIANECPMCVLEPELEQLRLSVHALQNENKRLHDEVERARGVVDLGVAITSAAELLDKADKMWLKEHLYQYKIDKSVVFRVHRSAEGNPAGLLAMRRKGEPDARTFTSIGGMALASAFEEAVTTMGANRAMSLLTDRLYKMLPGAKP